MAFLIQRLVSLSHNKVVLLVSSQINHLIRNYRIHPICLIHHPIRSLNKAILIHPGISSQGIDQSDVRTLRSLDGTHSSVMGIVNVTHLKSGPLSGQSAGSQGRKTPFVGQLCQRIVLIHELGKLGASEKLLHGRCNRLNINQRLRGNAIHILCGHTLPDHPLHPGQSDPVLVLQKFSHSTDTPVSQMVNIICCADHAFQMHIIINRSNNVFFCNVFGNQLIGILVHQFLQRGRILTSFFQNSFESRVIY